MNIVLYPTTALLFVLLIPIIYCWRWKKENQEKAVVIWFYGLVATIFYGSVIYLADHISHVGYVLGKLILFTIIPLYFYLYLEKGNIRTALSALGVTKEKIAPSIIWGIGAAIITLIIGLAVAWGQEGTTSLYWNISMFCDAFNEEFLYRGFFFIYIWKLTDIRIAYLTSNLAFILTHPQHFTSLFMVSTITQGLLLTFITHKTKNIIGPWISHGLNRTIIQVLRVFLF